MMRLDLLYVLGALWSAPAGSSLVCRPGPYAPLPAASAGVTAFINVNVVPMDSERVLANQTVLVDGGRITALGPAGQVPVPVGTVRVDGRGKYLMPGLTDMHNGPQHLVAAPRLGLEQAYADELFNRNVAQGVTAIRSIGGSSSSAVQRLRQIGADFPVPRMYLALGKIPNLPWSWPDSVATHLAALKAAGYSHIALSDNAITDADSVSSVALRRAGLPIMTHWHGAPFPQILQLGVNGGSAEHLYVFWDSLLGKAGPESVDPKTWKQQQPVDLSMSKVPALVKALSSAGVWITPTLVCMEGVHPYINGDGQARLVKALHDGGVKLLLGTDGGGVVLHSELRALVRAGLTPYEALLMGTRNVAEYFQRLDSAGTVVVGKQADLVLLNDNPLQDIRHAYAIAGVMVGGRWFDRVAVDQRLLASPRLWFERVLRDYIADTMLFLDPTLRELFSYWILSPPSSKEQWAALEQRVKQTYTLADSLDRTNRQKYERVLSLLSVELGAIRTILAPAHREAFDMNMQVWLREHARQGYSVRIPGVVSGQ